MIQSLKRNEMVDNFWRLNAKSFISIDTVMDAIRYKGVDMML